MKTILSLIITLFLFWVSPVMADIIPENSHSLERCVQILKDKNFSDIELFAVIDWPIPLEQPIFQIVPGTCLEKWYKFNWLSIYWNIATASGAIIDSSHLLSKNIETYGGYIDERDPLMSETIFYSLQKTQSGTLRLVQTGYIPIYSKAYTNKIFLSRLFITLLIEILFLFGYIKIVHHKNKIASTRIILAGFIASSITLYYFWKILPETSHPNWIYYVGILEWTICILEAIWYKYFLHISIRSALIISCIANLASIIGGIYLV